LEAALKILVQHKRDADAGRDVLGCLFEARAAGAIGNAEVIGQTLTIFNAAYHTTAYALTWALFLLAQHPDCLRRVHRELCETLEGEAPTLAQMGQLPLLDRTIRESLRLLPPVVYMPRLTLRDVRLGPYSLPVQSAVVVSPYVTHHSPHLWERPERFDPD